MKASIKPKKCKAPGCEVRFVPFDSFGVACSPKCALEIGRKQVALQRKADTRARRDAIKSRADWMREAQAAFNSYIRERDYYEGCICCGMYPKNGDWMGGKWDAGHFLSVGSHPELRFEESNCHKQLKSCNAGSGRFSSKARVVSQTYRERLLLKIGSPSVEWLEGPHEPRKHTIEELRHIKSTYSRKARELKKQRER